MSLVVSSLAHLRQQFGCDVAELPSELGILAWDGRGKQWHCTYGLSDRLTALIKALEPHVSRGTQDWWHPICINDALGERQPFHADYRMGPYPWSSDLASAPGALPSISQLKPEVLCFGAHVGDPRAVLLPDPHFLFHHYRKLRAQLLLDRRPWKRKQPRAVYAGGDHGEPANFASPRPGDPRHPRQVLRDLAPALKVPLDASLGTAVSRREQLRAMVVLDVDGFARTWDAWAWKMLGGSVTLSQESVWRSYFTEQFVAWEHYVPLRNDFSDLEQQIEWCLQNQGEARAIAERAKHKARDVYRASTVRRQTTAVLAPTL